MRRGLFCVGAASVLPGRVGRCAKHHLGVVDEILVDFVIPPHVCALPWAITDCGEGFPFIRRAGFTLFEDENIRDNIRSRAFECRVRQANRADQIRLFHEVFARRLVFRIIRQRPQVLRSFDRADFCPGEKKDAGNTPVFTSLLTMHGRKDAGQNLVRSYRLWYNFARISCSACVA